MQRPRQLVLFDQVAGDAVDQRIGRLHRRDVELGATEVGMRFDAAIGDGECAAVAKQKQFMRPHAVGGELADTVEFRPRVINANDARGVIKIVLGRIEQGAVGREHTMAEEMPAGDAGDGRWLLATGMVEDHRESAGLAGEDDRAFRHRVESNVMATVGQIERVQYIAGLGRPWRRRHPPRACPPRRAASWRRRSQRLRPSGIRGDR